MHTLSTRTLSALAYDRGEEYDPSQQIAPDLLETLSLVEHAAPVIGDDGPYERRTCGYAPGAWAWAFRGRQTFGPGA